MRVDLLARRWGGPDGGPDGMAVAAAFLAWTLCELGHEVRAFAAAPPAWSHARLKWQPMSSRCCPDDFSADLIITTIAPYWRRTALAANASGARDRTVFWHHHGQPPPGYGCHLATPNQAAAAGVEDWSSVTILPPSSWAAEVGGACSGDAILVPGAGPAKGGHVALEVARMCPDLRWYMLPGRCSVADVIPWRSLPNAEAAAGQIAPDVFLGRARAVLSPTRFEVHPLTLVEAAVRGIPIVCSDLLSTRAAVGESAVYVPVAAPPTAWAFALWDALRRPLPRLHLRPYGEVVQQALVDFSTQRRAVA